jgi:uncharacterized protein YutE (UPF0331/DUF86 family)
VEQTIARVREHLALINSIKEDCQKKFQIDPIYRGALLHYLYLMADTCITLAEQVIRFKKLRPAQSYHEAFDILGESGVLNREFAYSFAAIAGFRNFLAHDYEKIEAEIICNEVLTKLEEVEEFLIQIGKTCG